MTEPRFEIIAHRGGASVFGASSAPLKMDGGYLPPLTRFYAKIIADALNAKAGSANVSYSLRELA